MLLPFGTGVINPGTNGCPLSLTLWPNGGCLTDWAAKNLVLNYEHLKQWVDDAWDDCSDIADAGAPLPDGGVK